VTNCEDNISRLWCETVLPDDGLISLQHLDPEATQVGSVADPNPDPSDPYVFGLLNLDPDPLVNLGFCINLLQGVD
jgi:hypothetical protein